MKLRSILLSLAPALILSCGGPIETIDPEHTIWFDAPASIWEEALPLGNGRLGMMPDGGIGQEKIVLNEISMWSGCEADYSNPDAAESLPLIRNLLAEGRNAEAQKVMYERFVPHKPTDGGTYGSYQTLGDLIIMHGGGNGNIREYRRWLDLRTATAFTEYASESGRHYRKYYVSRDCDAIIVELSSERKGNTSFDATLSRSHDC